MPAVKRWRAEGEIGGVRVDRGRGAGEDENRKWQGICDGRRDDGLWWLRLEL